MGSYADFVNKHKVDDEEERKKRYEQNITTNIDYNLKYGSYTLTPQRQENLYLSNASDAEKLDYVKKSKQKELDTLSQKDNYTSLWDAITKKPDEKTGKQNTLKEWSENRKKKNELESEISNITAAEGQLKTAKRQEELSKIDTRTLESRLYGAEQVLNSGKYDKHSVEYTNAATEAVNIRSVLKAREEDAIIERLSYKDKALFQNYNDAVNYMSAQNLNGSDSSNPLSAFSNSKNSAEAYENVKKARQKLTEQGFSDYAISQTAKILQKRQEQAEAAEAAEAAYKFGNEHRWANLAVSPALNFASAVETAYKGTIRGDDYDPSTNTFYNVKNEATRGAVDTFEDGVLSKSTKAFLYQTGESMISSAASGFMPMGELMLSSSAASDSFNSAIEKGLDYEDAVLVGTLAGISEAVFEHLSLSKLKVFAETGEISFKGIIKDAVKSTVTNASEEAATEIANIISDYLISGGLSDYDQNVALLTNSGMSESDAKKQATRQAINQVAEAGLGGALMGPVFTAGGAAFNAANTAQYNAAAGKSILNEGTANEVLSGAQQLTGKRAQKLTSKVQSDQAAFIEQWAEEAAAKEKSSQENEEINENNDTSYSIKSFEDGTKYVEIDTDQAQFDDLTRQEQTKLARKILQDNFVGKVVGTTNQAYVNSDTASEYAHPRKRLDDKTHEAKMRASTELDNLLDAGTNFRTAPDGKDGHVHEKATGDFQYYDTVFKVGNDYYTGTINIMPVKKGLLLKDITNIKNITEGSNGSIGESQSPLFLSDVSDNNIKHSLKSVNTSAENNSKNSEIASGNYSLPARYRLGKLATLVNEQYNADVKAAQIDVIAERLQELGENEKNASELSQRIFDIIEYAQSEGEGKNSLKDRLTHGFENSSAAQQVMREIFGVGRIEGDNAQLTQQRLIDSAKSVYDRYYSASKQTQAEDVQTAAENVSQSVSELASSKIQNDLGENLSKGESMAVEALFEQAQIKYGTFNTEMFASVFNYYYQSGYSNIPLNRSGLYTESSGIDLDMARQIYGMGRAKKKSSQNTNTNYPARLVPKRPVLKSPSKGKVQLQSIVSAKVQSDGKKVVKVKDSSGMEFELNEQSAERMGISKTDASVFLAAASLGDSALSQFAVDAFKANKSNGRISVESVGTVAAYAIAGSESFEKMAEGGNYIDFSKAVNILGENAARRVFDYAKNKKPSRKGKKAKKSNGTFTDNAAKKAESVAKVAAEYDEIKDTVVPFYKAVAARTGLDIVLEADSENANGSFNTSSGTLTVFLDATNQYNTLIHELTHAISAYNPSAYKDLQGCVEDWYIDTYGKIEYEQTLVDLMKQWGVFDKTEIAEEFTAETMSGIFADENALNQFLSWLKDDSGYDKAKQKNIIQKIAEAFNEIIQKLKKVVNDFLSGTFNTDAARRAAAMAENNELKARQLRFAFFNAIDKINGVKINVASQAGFDFSSIEDLTQKQAEEILAMDDIELAQQMNENEALAGQIDEMYKIAEEEILPFDIDDGKKIIDSYIDGEGWKVTKYSDGSTLSEDADDMILPFSRKGKKQPFELKGNNELAQKVKKLKGSEKYKAIADYILNTLAGQDIVFNDGRKAVVDKRDAGHLSRKANSLKVAELSELQQLIARAELIKDDTPVEHNKFTHFAYYETGVQFDGTEYNLVFNVGKGKVDNKYHLYELNHPQKRNARGGSSTNGEVSLLTGNFKNNISNTDENVKFSLKSPAVNVDFLDNNVNSKEKKTARGLRSRSSIIRRTGLLTKAVSNDNIANFSPSVKQSIAENTTNSSEEKDIKWSLKNIPNENQIESNYQTVANMDAVAELTGNEFEKSNVDLITQVTDYFHSIGGKVSTEYGEVELNRRGVKSSIAHGIGRTKAAAFMAVPQVLTNGKILGYAGNWKGRGYDGAVFAAPVEIGGKKYFEGVVVKVQDNDNRLYLHEVKLTDTKNDASFKTASQPNLTAISDASSIDSVLQRLVDVKPSGEISSENLEDIRHSLKIHSDEEQISALQSRNSELLKQNRTLGKRLRAVQYKLDGRKYNMVVDLNKTQSFVKRMLKDYNSNADLNHLTDMLTKAYNIRINNGSLRNFNAALEEIANEIIKNSDGIDNGRSEFADEILSDIRKTKIGFSEADREKAAYAFDSWNNYRKSLFGRARLVNLEANPDAISLDQWWYQASEQWPWIFDAQSSSQVSEFIGIIQTLSEREIEDIDNEASRQMIVEELRSGLALVPQSGSISGAERVKLTRLAAEAKNEIKRIKSEYKLDYKQRLSEAKKQIRENEREKFNERVDAKVWKLTEKERAALLEAKAKVLMRQQAREDTASRAAYRSKLEKVIKRLDRMLRQPGQIGTVPEELRNPVSKLLNMFTSNSSVFDYKQLDRLSDTYQHIMNTTEASCSEDILEKLQTMKNTVAGKRLAQLSNEELSTINDIVNHFITLVKTENEIFSMNKWQNVDSLGQRAMSEIANSKALTSFKGKDFLVTGNLTPAYAFKKLGGTLNEMYKDIRRGQQAYAKGVENVKKFYDAQAEKFHVSSWLNGSHEYTTQRGTKLTFTTQQILTIFATFKREMMRPKPSSHLMEGGVVFKQQIDKKSGKVKENETSYQLTLEDLKSLSDLLSDEQKNFADAMVKYLSQDIAAFGNETSMQLYGYRMFTEQYYFPFNSSKSYMHANFSEAADGRLKNMGFTKDTVHGANNPLVLDDFTSIWSKHCERMISYSSFVIPIENFTKVWNYKWKDSVHFDFDINQRLIDDFVENAATKSNTQDYIKYAKPSQRLLADLQSDINLDGYTHVLRDNDIRHILNSHGEGTKEKYPVTLQDIKLIPYIVENYDKVYYKTNARGEPGVLYVKAFEDGVVYYVEAAVSNDNGNSLINKQMIKGSYDSVPRIYENLVTQKQGRAAVLNDLKSKRRTSETAPQDALLSGMIPKNNSFVKDGENLSLRAALINTFGSDMTSYVEQFMRDLNGAAKPDAGETMLAKMTTRFKKNSVLLNASVAIQQPSAVARAFAYINPKYFVRSTIRRPLASFEEAKKYASAALMKDIGGYNVGMGSSISSWITESTNSKDTLWQKATDAVDKAGGFLPEKADAITWGHIWEAAKRKVAAEEHLKGEQLLERAGEMFDEVVDLTQVYDSTFTRSGNMRSKSTAMNALTAFMAEPTVTYNMLMDAFSGKKSAKFKASVLASVITATIFNSLLKSLIYAVRHKDKDETLLEAYLSEFVGNIFEDSNPLSMIPFVKDIVSIIEGYDVSRTDMSIVSTLINDLQKLSREASGLADSENKLWDGTKLAGNALADVAYFAGIPIKNLNRDVWAIIKAASPSDGKTTSETLKHSVQEATFPLSKAIAKSFGFVENETKGDKLYNAYLADDEESFNRIAAQYSNASAIRTAIMQHIKEDFLNGDIGYDEAYKLLEDLNYDKIDDKISSWSEESQDNDENSSEKITLDNFRDNLSAARSKGDILYEAWLNGDSSVYNETAAQYTSGTGVKTALSNHIKKDYLDGIITYEEAYSRLSKLGYDKIDEKITGWTASKEEKVDTNSDLLHMN